MEMMRDAEASLLAPSPERNAWPRVGDAPTAPQEDTAGPGFTLPL